MQWEMNNEGIINVCPLVRDSCFGNAQAFDCAL
jgi:hypothetical protein